MLQVLAEHLHESHGSPVLAYWSEPWNETDRKLLRVRRESADQAKYEAYALLHSVLAWRDMLATAQGSLAIIGGALGILHDLVKFRARDPVLNEVVGEIALLMAPMGLDIRAAHV